MEEITSNKEFAVIYGFIHGSFVYNNNDFTCGAYKETMCFDKGKYIESVFTLKNQNPDVDIVIIASDIKGFVDRFNTYLESSFIIKDLNYFLTINVMSESVFAHDIKSTEPTALKRILKFRKLLGFGNANFIELAKEEVEKSITDLDSIVQHEYDERKAFLRDKMQDRQNEFSISEEEYERLFPVYYKYILKGKTAGFPEDREKIVLPHPMDLKAKIDKSTGSVEFLR